MFLKIVRALGAIKILWAIVLTFVACVGYGKAHHWDWNTFWVWFAYAGPIIYGFVAAIVIFVRVMLERRRMNEAIKKGDYSMFNFDQFDKQESDGWVDGEPPEAVATKRDR